MYEDFLKNDKLERRFPEHWRILTSFPEFDLKFYNLIELILFLVLNFPKYFKSWFPNSSRLSDNWIHQIKSTTNQNYNITSSAITDKISKFHQSLICRKLHQNQFIPCHKRHKTVARRQVPDLTVKGEFSARVIVFILLLKIYLKYYTVFFKRYGHIWQSVFCI